jgi:hypothetical protein
MANEPYLPVNPCEGCDIKRRPCSCWKLARYKTQLAAIEKVLTELKKRSTKFLDIDGHTQDSVPIYYIESILTKIKEAKDGR